MPKIKNLTNSPYDIPGAGRLPAFGELAYDGTDEYLDLLRHSGVVEVLDSDTDDELETWRKLYTELTGKRPHHLWKMPRIQKEIDEWESE